MWPRSSRTAAFALDAMFAADLLLDLLFVGVEGHGQAGDHGDIHGGAGRQFCEGGEKERVLFGAGDPVAILAAIEEPRLLHGLVPDEDVVGRLNGWLRFTVMVAESALARDGHLGLGRVTDNAEVYIRLLQSRLPLGADRRRGRARPTSSRSAPGGAAVGDGRATLTTISGQRVAFLSLRR